ncbi:unnamed protein product [Diabrotica balteata]|uniref:Uncharacterized protein n=1 Tax=Diabrotica balteata TaxID=107213 RepID=A0A9N9STM3_DIABA|nr:unnamed protein product [Diabrotica balteata]
MKIKNMIIAGAFYPNFFIREQNPNEVDDKQHVRAVGGRDPFRSVYLTGMDSEQPGPLYIRAIKSLFKNENDRNTNISIGFDSSNKIYVEFKVLSHIQNRMAISINGRQMVADTILGKIPREVYEAIRKRQLQHPFQLHLLPIKEAWKYAEERGHERKSTLQKLQEDTPMPSTSADRNCFSLESHSPIPGLDVEWITLKITEVHSVVDKVVYLEIYKRDPHMNNSKSLNRVMLEDGWAEPAVESFLSKVDSENRQKVHSSDNPRAEAVRLSFDKVQNYDDFDAPNISTRGKTIHLKGPFSPLEMKVYSCLESSNSKSIDVEGSSINTVLLDTAPQDQHTRLLVAAYVSQSASSDRLKLRQTTLMPNIPGLPMLLTLLFCPKMSPKVTDDGTKVASILCGLGYDPITLKSYYPSHDFILTLDTELTEEEVNRVNSVRFAMNQGLKVMADVAFENANPRDMLLKQKELKKSLMELLHADRRSVERSTVQYANIWHKNNFESTILTSGMDENQIWPLLDFVKLCNRQGYHPEVSKNLNDLDLMARKMIPAVPIQCYLCGVELLFVHDVRFHLISKEHKEKVAVYNPQYD